MIIRKDTTKARRADKTTGRGAAPAALACYRRDARTPASQRSWSGTPACSLLPFGPLVVRLRIIIFFL